MSSHQTRYPDALAYNAMAASGANVSANTTAQPLELTWSRYARTRRGLLGSPYGDYRGEAIAAL
jgi:hypothetical protein